VTAHVVDMRAVGELRRLVHRLPDDGLPPVELVVAIADAANRTGERIWARWAARAFDPAHDAQCSCRRRTA